VRRPEGRRTLGTGGWRFRGAIPKVSAGHHFGARRTKKEAGVIMGTILIVVLVLLLLGAIPVWPHSKSWGYYPTGGLGLVLTILVILILLGRL